ncbi:uncharacterized protein LOC116426097 [Nomia melanderi]|uniref:uncharacterized protein LOC116426097 n=1 Tax=Nomia melanderi TaxID=2448451 RepID=UPI00130455CB|nr:uncharacterized protein LOC116426097 [Nomia melanderi]
MSEKLETDQDIISHNSSSSSSGIPPFKKPRLLEKWLRDPEMSTWLRKREDEHAWCAICETHLKTSIGKIGLKKHANSLHHKMNVHKKMEGAGTSSAPQVSKNEIKEAEIRYCLFAVEHNVNFQMFQALSKLNKIIASKLPLMQCIKLGRTKIRAIIKNVINKSLILDIKEMLKEKYFSLIINESTDNTNVKSLSILVRFIDNRNLETQLLDLIRIKEATAENMYKCILHSLNRFNLSVSNMIGVGVDNANVVIEAKKSLMSQYIDNKLDKPESSTQIIEFYKNVQKFSQTAHNDKFLAALNFTNPKVALDDEKHTDQIEIVLKKYPSIFNTAKVTDQWFLLSMKPTENEQKHLQTLGAIEFWYTISDLKDELGNLLYDEIAKLAFLCLSLPHSNADVDKFFSTITDIKNKKRCRLDTQMICAMTRIKLHLQSKHIDACSFKISNQLLHCFNYEMYNKEEIPSELRGILLPDETDENDSNSDAL